MFFCFVKDIRNTFGILSRDFKESLMQTFSLHNLYPRVGFLVVGGLGLVGALLLPVVQLLNDHKICKKWFLYKIKTKMWIIVKIYSHVINKIMFRWIFKFV